MDQNPNGSEALARAQALAELGIRAATAYDRPDLARRLGAVRRTLAEPGVHIVVVGEFKQGKSSLVNALVGAPACPVDDDVATAVATYVRHGERPGACLLYDEDPPRRVPVSFDQVRSRVVESSAYQPDPPAGVEIRLPRTMLAGGLVVVDTPGLGGLSSAHAAASLTASATADALLFVTDASQELTAAELTFLRQARELCPAVMCVLTKTDFYPAWRTVRDLDRGHLATALPDVAVVAVSSTLRSLAVRGGDPALNAESGFPELVAFVTGRVAGDGRHRLAVSAAAEVMAVCEQLESQFAAERAVLADPSRAAAVVAELTAAKQRSEELRGAAARWNQTLSDGIADLTSDTEHDLRSRVRAMIAAADEAVDAADPADAWPQLESWLEARTAQEVVTTYTRLRTQALALSDLVGEHFRDGVGAPLTGVQVYDPAGLVHRQQISHKIELERMTVGKQTMVALRNSYSGILMFTVLGSLANISLGPLGLGIGLVMGHRGLKDEKRRQLEQRRAQARNAVRRYCDEVHFVIGKDSRDTLRRVQRQLRDHYSSRAEELNRSTAQALRVAGETVSRSTSEREGRLRDVDAELVRLRRLRERATAVTLSGGSP